MTTATNKEMPWPWIFGAIVLSAWLFNNGGQKPIQPSPTIPQVTISESLQALKQVAAAGDKQTVSKLAALYSDFADVLSRVEPGSLQSGQLRSWLIKADTYLIRGTNMVGAVPGFGAAKDRVFKEALGDEDRPLEAKDLAVAVAACRSIADALGAK